MTDVNPDPLQGLPGPPGSPGLPVSMEFFLLHLNRNFTLVLV